jgi:copper homeostasis protein (lipoprotein)
MVSMARITFPGWLPFMLALALAGCGLAGEDAAPPAPAALAADDGEAFDLAWQGVLPCADCTGIRTRLRLWRDDAGQAFELEETYLGVEGDNVFSTSGAWRLEQDGGAQATRYRLGSEGGGLGFELLADGSLQLLDADGEPPAEAAAYRLHRL